MKSKPSFTGFQEQQVLGWWSQLNHPLPGLPSGGKYLVGIQLPLSSEAETGPPVLLTQFTSPAETGPLLRALEQKRIVKEGPDP